MFVSLYALPINNKYFSNRHWELIIGAWWHLQATTSFSMHTIILANMDCSCLLCSIFFLLICAIWYYFIPCSCLNRIEYLFTSIFINSKLYICRCVCCVLHLYSELHNFLMQQKENTVQNVRIRKTRENHWNCQCSMFHNNKCDLISSVAENNLYLTFQPLKPWSIRNRWILNRW